MMSKDGKDKVDVEESGEKITAEQVKEQAGEIFRKLPLLGPISWLYGQSRTHQHLFFSDLNWMVMPALVNDQYKLYLKNDAPMSYVSWACVSREILERIQKSNQLRLAPHEWSSGETILVMDVVAPFGRVEALVNTMRNSIFPDEVVHMYVPTMPGQKEGRVVRLPKASGANDDEKEADSSTNIH